MASVRHALVLFIGISCSVLFAAGWVDGTNRAAGNSSESANDATVASQGSVASEAIDPGETAGEGQSPISDVAAGELPSTEAEASVEYIADPYANPVNTSNAPDATSTPAPAVRHAPAPAKHAATAKVAAKAKPRTLKRVYRVTAYCDQGITASGRRVGVGQCAGPAALPFGSKVHIPALNRTFVVTDRTAQRFRHNTVDIFMPVRADCVEFGRNYLECVVVLPDKAAARR